MLIRQKRGKGKWGYSLIFSQNEFVEALTKFKGGLIFRGNKRRSRRYFDDMLFELKKKVKGKIPLKVVHEAFNNLYPIFGASKRRYGKKFINLPAFAMGNRKNVVLMNWVLRGHKNKTNVRGYKMDEIFRSIIDASQGKGKAMLLKRNFNEQVLASRNLLINYGSEENEEENEKYDSYQDMMNENIIPLGKNKVEPTKTLIPIFNNNKKLIKNKYI